MLTHTLTSGSSYREETELTSFRRKSISTRIRAAENLIARKIWKRSADAISLHYVRTDVEWAVDRPAAPMPLAPKEVLWYWLSSWPTARLSFCTVRGRRLENVLATHASAQIPVPENAVPTLQPFVGSWRGPRRRVRSWPISTRWIIPLPFCFPGLADLAFE